MSSTITSMASYDDDLKTLIREQAQIVILEDETDKADILLNLFLGDGYRPENIHIFASVEEMMVRYTVKDLQKIDLFSVDHFLAGEMTGLAFIEAMNAKHYLLEKQRFILVSGYTAREEALRNCPLIYEVFDKATFSSVRYYSAVEAALLESFTIKEHLQEGANSVFNSALEKPYVAPDLSGTAKIQHDELLRIFNTRWFDSLVQSLSQCLSPQDQTYQRFLSMKNTFLATIDYLFLNSRTLTKQEALSAQEINIAYLALKTLFNEPYYDAKRIIPRRKKMISFLQTEYRNPPQTFYTETLPQTIQQMYQWLTLAEKEACFTIKRKYTSEQMVDRLAAIFYINPLRLKVFSKTYGFRIADLAARLENDSFAIPFHKFKHNNMLYEDLTGFVQKLFD